MKDVTFLARGPTRVDCKYDKRPIWCVYKSWEFAEELDVVFLVDGWEEHNMDELLKEKEIWKFHIVAANPHPDVPDIEVFPIEEILRTFPTKYFTTVICYQLAYAILKGYDRIWFYGIDLIDYASYIAEKGGIEFWMGVCKARGVHIINTKHSATGKTADGRPFGFWGDREEEVELACKRIEEEDKRIAAL